MASCIADAFYNARCNGIVGCDPEEVVVDSGQRTASWRWDGDRCVSRKV